MAKKSKNDKMTHHVLGFERRSSGAFEHSWGVAQNLGKREKDVSYLTHWWNSPVKKLDLRTEESNPVDFKKYSKSPGVYHLQTHTWEHEGLLDNISDNPESRMVYNLHAIIPYLYLEGGKKDGFLSGKITYDEVIEDVSQKMRQREFAQLSAMEKADYLFVISQNHRRVLERMGVQSPVHVFENISDVDSIPEDVMIEAKMRGEEFRNEIEAENALLYCGALYGTKGSHRLFEAFRTIREDNPSSKLVILGSGEDRVSNLLSSGMNRDDLESVVLAPWINKNTQEGQKEFLKYYFGSDVLIQPMVTEGLFAKTVIDAMTLGLPAISCKSPYTIGQSRTAEDIVNSFEQMKSNPQETERTVEAAKEKVKRENTWDSYISRMEQIVSE